MVPARQQQQRRNGVPVGRKERLRLLIPNAVQTEPVRLRKSLYRPPSETRYGYLGQPGKWKPDAGMLHTIVPLTL